MWAQVKKLAVSELCNKRLFVVDAFCGANKRHPYGRALHRGGGLAGTLY